MKLDRIPTRRKPVKRTLYAKVFSKTKTKKQRASAAALSPEEIEGPSLNISRSLSIIFAIHIVAIGMIFIHKQYLSGRTTTTSSSDSVAAENEVVSKPVQNNDLPVLSSGDQPYMVKKGDNYSVIANRFQVDESELRSLNRGADIRAGVVLRIPKGKRIVAEQPREIAVLSQQPVRRPSDEGLVEILPPISTAEAQVVRPNTSITENAPRAIPVDSAKSHTVKSGESVWRISNQYKVDQKKLMEMNGITDPTKLKIGQILKLP